MRDFLLMVFVFVFCFGVPGLCGAWMGYETGSYWVGAFGALFVQGVIRRAAWSEW